MPAADVLIPAGVPKGTPLFDGRRLFERLTRSSEDGLKRAHFKNHWIAAALLSPQLIILLFFFFIPSWKALSLAFVQVDPFGGKSLFVGWRNFTELFASEPYRNSAWLTFWFTIVQNIATLALAGALAFATDHIIRGRFAYRSILLLPYAIAPVISGAIWAYLFNPTVGMLAYALQALGYPWDHKVSGTDALALVTIAASWKQVSYNFIFFLAGLQAIPKSMIEAAAIDGASPIRRFWTIVFPLLSPTTFFLVVVNVVYAFFDTFGVIHATTEGGPAGATTVLVYKVFSDGFIGLDLGGSAAQSVVLMAIVIVLTVAQFRYIERKVAY